MILSTQSLIMQRAYGYEDGVRALKRIGFDAYDFTMFDMAEQPDDPMTRADFRETCRSLRKAADEAGILCNQTHAPFPSRKADDAAWNGVIFDYLARSVEITSLLGGNVCVIHPCNDYTAKQNAELLYRPLEKHARKFGVKIALENMWNFSRQANKAVPCACSTAEDFLKHLDLLDPEYFVACLDIGHAEMLGDCVSAAELIRALGVKEDGQISRALMTGMVTDSGGFSHSDVNGDSFRAAGEMADAGADVNQISYETMKKQSRSRAQFFLKALSRLRFLLDDRFTAVVVSGELLDEFALDTDATEGLVDFGLTIDATEVSACFLEVRKGQYKISLRSKGKVNVNEVAGVFGGGGHILASGCVLFGEEEEVVEKIKYAVWQRL